MVQTMKRALRKCSVDGGGKDWNELLPYVAMGYKISDKKCVVYNPYVLMFYKDPTFQGRLQHLHDEEVGLYTTAEWLLVFLEERGQTFNQVMPLPMRNLAIAWQRDKERYKLVLPS